MPLALKRVLAEAGLSQRKLGQAIGISGGAVNALVNLAHWPGTVPRPELERRVKDFLREHGIATKGIFDLDEMADQGGNPDRPLPHTARKGRTTEGDIMLMAKQSLTPAAMRHFGLRRDPFGDIDDAADVFRSDRIRLVREHMLQTAKSGGFLAVVGESGSGKSTLADDIEDSLPTEAPNVVLIRPYVIGMEGDDTRGKRLKAGAILDAIIRGVSPQSGRPSALQPKAEVAHEVLKESYQSGRRHCLLIDEAHRLAVPTLRHLKGFYELRVGHKKLLSIVLIGQPELHTRLDERNPELREVTQRCQVLALPPLDDALPDFLAHRLARAGRSADDIFGDGAMKAVRDTLTFSRGKSEAISLCYPLAAQNRVTAALNLAAAMGAPKVTADIVEEV